MQDLGMPLAQWMKIFELPLVDGSWAFAVPNDLSDLVHVILVRIPVTPFQHLAVGQNLFMNSVTTFTLEA